MTKSCAYKTVLVVSSVNIAEKLNAVLEWEDKSNLRKFIYTVGNTIIIGAEIKGISCTVKLVSSYIYS